MRKHVSELVISAVILLFGIFMLLSGLNVFPFTAKKVAYLSVCICFFAIGTAIAVIQKNPIGLFIVLFFAVLTVSASLLLAGYTSRNIYPIYIMAAPVGALGIANRLPCFRITACVSAAIIGAALILMFESFAVLKIGVVLPIVIVYFSIIGIIYASLKLGKKSEKEDM